MTFNINEFKTRGLQYGGAKASLFQVNIANPFTGAADDKIPFLIQASTLPPSELGTIEVPYFGRKIKVAGDRTFGEWSVTVINDEDFKIRDTMEEWMGRINSHASNLRETGQLGAPVSYKSDAQITQFGKDSRILKEYNFVGLFPTNIAEIAMDWDTTDDIERFDITFQYDYWTISQNQNGQTTTLTSTTGTT